MTGKQPTVLEYPGVSWRVIPKTKVLCFQCRQHSIAFMYVISPVDVYIFQSIMMT